MILKVQSVDFEENLLTFSLPQELMNKIGWCFGDECEVDLSEQLNRCKDKIQLESMVDESDYNAE